jgi:hypothetical protein
MGVNFFHLKYKKISEWLLLRAFGTGEHVLVSNFFYDADFWNISLSGRRVSKKARSLNER